MPLIFSWLLNIESPGKNLIIFFIYKYEESEYVKLIVVGFKDDKLFPSKYKISSSLTPLYMLIWVSP